MSLFIKILIVLGVIALGVLFIVFLIKKRRKKVLENLKAKLFLVKLPRESREGKDPMQEIAKNEQFFSALTSFKKPVVFEVAVPHVGEEIHFYAAVSPEWVEPFTRQLHSLWSDAVVEEVGDYNIFQQSGTTLGCYLQQKEKYLLPLRTYKEVNSDTFQSILGGLSKVNEIGEGAAIQLVIKSPSTSYKKNMKSAIKYLKKGGKLKDLGSFSLPKLSNKKEEEKTEPKEIDDSSIKAIESKISKPVLEINARILVSAASQYQAETIFDGLISGYAQFSSAHGNDIKVVKARKPGKLAHKFSFREFNENQKMVLNTEELASIFHFPTPFTELPKLKSLKSKQLPAPVNLPTSGLLLGENIYRGSTEKVYLTEEDRRRHLYIIGQTGTGKSNLQINLASSDIKNGKGVCVVDPHGDLIEDVLGTIPPERAEDVVLFDPSAINNPIGLNMLEYDRGKPEEKTFIINEMISIFDKLYDMRATGGPMFEHYMRNALLLLMEGSPPENQATLMEVPRVFSDDDFRNGLLERSKNPSVIDFWEKEATKARGEASLSNITPYIASKFNNFISNEYVRLIIGQPNSAFNFRKIMDEGKILLVNLIKGRIGDLSANLLGMIVVGKLLMAALSRVDVPEEQRKDFNLYIDEFQNFTTESIAVILSEARKYRLSLTIAHQFIAQLREDIRDAVFGNVGSMIAFRVGADDAEYLVKPFESYLTVEDFINIDNYHAYVRMLLNGETTRPFNIKTLKADTPDIERAEKIAELSHLKYGKDREGVESMIYEKLRKI